MKNPFISVCIPSYNRPQELLRLLRTIDSNPQETQIVICEDKAPKRLEVRDCVNEFLRETQYDVKYIENEVNKGYDWNVRDFITQADGTYIVYCDDDSAFVPGALDKLISFLKKYPDVGYVLRRTRSLVSKEDMRYYPETCFFEPGIEAYKKLSRKSVIIAGFTFKRELAIEHMTDRFDGSLLYQLYILVEICMKHRCTYFDEPLTQKLPGKTEFYFGASEKEKGLYVPGKISAKGQMNFVLSFLDISRFIDEKYGVNSLSYVKKDLSKYAYPILEWVLKAGRMEMIKCARLMIKAGMGTSIYFYCYFFGLFFFGAKFCRRVILFIKRRLGHTPEL